MNSLKYFNKEINLAKRDGDIARFDKAWEDLETWRDGLLFQQMQELFGTADEDVYNKRKKEYEDAWALGMKCFDIQAQRIYDELGITFDEVEAEEADK